MFADTYLVVLALAALAFVCWVAWLGRTLQFALDLPLLKTTVDLDPLLFQRLCAVKGTAVTDASHGRFTQSMRRAPGWAIVAALVTLPFGLVFLLVRTRRDLHFSVVPTANGDVLRVTGETEAYLWARTCRSLAPLLEHPTDAAAGQSPSSSPATASS